MATATQTPKTATTPKVAKPAVKFAERIKNQLTQAVLRKSITADEFTDLESHIKKLASFLS